jgi:hypothetical protein
MTRLRIALVSLAVALSLVGPSVAPAARAAGSGVEPSDVVFVFDFSTSMRLPAGNTKANATAKALDLLAKKIRLIEQKLIKKSPTIHMLHFANEVDVVPGCGNTKTSNSKAVEEFAKCLELVAKEYRGNIKAWEALGINVQGGTNYGVAFEKAFSLMEGGPDKRPAVVFFTDGLNLPNDESPPEDWIDAIVAQAEVERLDPRAILPVGLKLSGTKPIADLENLYKKGTNLLKCNEEANGEPVSWPRVNFSTADSAAEAIAQAFSRVVCVDIVTPDAPEDIEAISDGESTTVTWGNLPKGSIDAEGYEVTCGDVKETVGSGSSSAVLPIGDAKDCSVASTITNAEGDEVSGTPSEPVPVISPPQPPKKPSVSPGDSSIGAETKPGDGADGKSADGGDPISGYKWECTDVATGQPAATAESSGAQTSITGVSNGSEYTCSATAVNKAGESKPSEQSDSVKPCNGIFECNPWIAPLLLLALLLALVLALLLFIYWLRERTRGFVTATIDSNRPLALLRGPTTGFSFVSTTVDSVINGARIERSSVQHVAIENKGSDRFKWTDNVSKVSGTVERGGTFQVADPAGGNHQIRLRAYSAQTNDPTTISWSLVAVGNEQMDWGGGSSSDSGWGEATSSWEAPATGPQGTSGGWD